MTITVPAWASQGIERIGIIPISHATETLRELTAALLAEVPMWAALYHSEPDPSDPLATLVDATGLPTVPILWLRRGVTLSNSLPLVFTGVSNRETASWIGITLDQPGRKLLAYGSIDPTPGTGTGRDWFTVPVDVVKVVVV